jgi:hypothetical protein
MITIPGQLAIKTIHGRNGDFNVGRLTTSIGEFVTKNAELDQYREGKYEGDFCIAEIRPSMYTTGGRMVIELRAVLAGMDLSNLESLTKDEAHRMSGQEVDPIDEEAAGSQQPIIPASSAPTPEKTPSASDLSPQTSTISQTDTAPGSDDASSEACAENISDDQADVALFGSVWPLGPIVKLDRTVDRLLLRKQRNRLDELGYAFDYVSQEWSLKAAA